MIHKLSGEWFTDDWGFGLVHSAEVVSVLGVETSRPYRVVISEVGDSYRVSVNSKISMTVFDSMHEAREFALSRIIVKEQACLM